MHTNVVTDEISLNVIPDEDALVKMFEPESLEWCILSECEFVCGQCIAIVCTAV